MLRWKKMMEEGRFNLKECRGSFSVRASTMWNSIPTIVLLLPIWKFSNTGSRGIWKRAYRICLLIVCRGPTCNTGWTQWTFWLFTTLPMLLWYHFPSVEFSNLNISGKCSLFLFLSMQCPWLHCMLCSLDWHLKKKQNTIEQIENLQALCDIFSTLEGCLIWGH